MAFYRKPLYRFREPRLLAVTPLPDLSKGMNTRDPEDKVAVRLAWNVRFGKGAMFRTRPGSQRKGEQIGTTTQILGLHSYPKKGVAAQLLATFNTDIYKYSEANSPQVIATSTNSQATGYPKDRHVFMTTANLDANGRPYVVALYQSGAGIIQEWADSTGAVPYATWSNTPVTVDASVQLGFSAYMDSSDNLHVAYNSVANFTYYVKLTYAAGPVWNIGTKYFIKGSSGTDAANSPTITRKTDGMLFVAYRYFDGTNYRVRSVQSTDSGVTWGSETDLSTPSANVRHFALLTQILGFPLIVYQVGGASTSYYFRYNTGSWSSETLLETQALGADRAFSAVITGTSLSYTIANTASSSGLSHLSYGSADGAQRRVFSVVNDAPNDNDVQYQNVIGGTTDSVATRVSNDALNNLWPSAPESVSSSSSFVPVLWTEGLVSPYNVKINSSVKWSALSASLTANKPMNSAFFPSTAAGGTDSHYFANGTNAVKKWDGTALSSAAAAGYPVPTWIVSYENRLWMGNSLSNRVSYTDRGADNFAGTFPSANTVDFPRETLWGHVYRNSVLLVFARDTAYRMENFDYTGANVGPEKLRAIPDSYGILSGRTVQQVGGWVYYQRPDGHVMRTNGQYAELVSDSIRPTIEGLALTQLGSAAAGTVGSEYRLAVADSASGRNNLVLVLDTTKAPDGGWSIDTGQSASCFVTHPDSSGFPSLYFGEASPSNGSVYQADTGTNDNGAAIALRLETGVLTYGSSFYRTVVRGIVVVAEASGNYFLTFGHAKLSNLSSFVTRDISLAPGGPIWGAFVWGSFTWGGKSHAEEKFTLNSSERGFKYLFSNSGLDQPVAVVSVEAQHEPAKDAV